MGGRTALLAIALILAPSLTAADPHPSGPREPPPPPKDEEVTLARPGYVWIDGHWTWRHGQYVWARGHTERVRRGRDWHDGAWVLHGDHYEWRPGRWQPRARRTR